MRKKITYYFVLVIIIFISCSSPSEPTENALSFESLEGHLKISNNSNKTIYLFVVERGILINWAPHFNEPKVLKYDSILIDYSEIYKGEEPVKSGDEVIVNFWDDSNKSKPDIYSRVVVL